MIWYKRACWLKTNNQYVIAANLDPALRKFLSLINSSLPQAAKWNDLDFQQRYFLWSIISNLQNMADAVAYVLVES